MTVINWAKSQIKTRVLKIVDAEVEKNLEFLLPQLLQFQNSCENERSSYYDHTKDNNFNYEDLANRLIIAGVPVKEIEVDINDFKIWLDKSPEINFFYKNMGEVYIEKCLEHYLAYRFLNITTGDIYIDIAALGSPWSDALNQRGIKSYRLDLIYPEGIHGKNIGADAGNTKLPDSFATVLSAQCAYECFAGDADIRFIKEAARILKKKGRYGIVPLYVDNEYFVSTSPYCNQRDVIIENEAKKVWRDDKYKVPFSRHYSPESFYTRIYSILPSNMTGKVYYFKNLSDIQKCFEGQRVYCHFMFCCEKTA
jgi:hypothetical protein